MSRKIQYQKFIEMLVDLLYYCEIENIPIRLGEAHRPFFVAQKYKIDGMGIINSKHRYSLAIDLWIISDSGKEILWEDERYKMMGKFWTEINGTWGGDFKKLYDPYHFEFKGKPA